MTPRFSTVAVVTGAGSGIGRATAERLAADGASVACLDVDERAAAATAATVGRGRAFLCDVTDEAQVAAAVAAAETELGPVGIVVANAGVTGPVAQVPDISLDAWQRVLAVNMTGVFLTAKHGIAALRRNGGGALVITASNAAVNAEPGWAAYAATKGAVLALGRSLGVDHAHEGIRVNCVCPGAIDTPLLRSGYIDQLGPEIVEDPSIPLPAAAGAPSQVAAVIAFLASDDAALVNAVGVVADGGSASRMGAGFGGQLGRV